MQNGSQQYQKHSAGCSQTLVWKRRVWWSRDAASKSETCVTSGWALTGKKRHRRAFPKHLQGKKGFTMCSRQAHKVPTHGQTHSHASVFQTGVPTHSYRKLEHHAHRPCNCIPSRGNHDAARYVVCQLPPEAGQPWYIGTRLKSPAYGMHAAPHTWWHRLDSALKPYGLQPTRADRCCYVMYEDGPFQYRYTADVVHPRTCDGSLNTSTIRSRTYDGTQNTIAILRNRHESYNPKKADPWEQRETTRSYEAMQDSAEWLEATLHYLHDPVSSSKAHKHTHTHTCGENQTVTHGWSTSCWT